MVIVFDAHAAETPAGKPFAPETPEFEIPVALVVECVMFVKAVFRHTVGVEDAAVTVFGGDIASKIDVFLPPSLRFAEPAILFKIDVLDKVAAAIENFLLFPFARSYRSSIAVLSKVQLDAVLA